MDPRNLAYTSISGGGAAIGAAADGAAAANKDLVLPPAFLSGERFLGAVQLIAVSATPLLFLRAAKGTRESRRPVVAVVIVDVTPGFHARMLCTTLLSSMSSSPSTPLGGRFFSPSASCTALRRAAVSRDRARASCVQQVQRRGKAGDGRGTTPSAQGIATFTGVSALLFPNCIGQLCYT